MDLNDSESGVVLDTNSDDLIVDESALNTVKSIIKHQKSVKRKLTFLQQELKQRADTHDLSKLEYPEIKWLIEMDKEPRYKYGTQEYFDKMKRWAKFFNHHYKENRHHPDHFSSGVEGMNLADLSEYLMDIISYYDEMHVDDAIKTIEAQQSRFKIDTQLAQVLKNTLLDYYAWVGDNPPVSIDS